MARLYANENFPMPVVKALRRVGHNVLTTREVGTSGQAASDEEVLGFARSKSRAVLTFNRKHFIRLHSIRLDHSGIVVCTFAPDFEGQASRIHEALKSREQLSGQLVRVNRPERG